ncbi:signal peptide protein [Rhodopirellula sallentina SM41]|uniref:Signal peptide protein n=1 Tax=Rhodopirellula sallentina SM41 TaxID=1263870 RepID=M5U8W2_9BACT|nr:signal peptide protein [Rhodopirellula sallentina SM41]
MLQLTAVAHSQGFVITQNQFESWIFSTLRNQANARTVLKDRIKLEIDRLDQVAPLTQTQKVKIRFAGKGDISRFFRDADAAIAEFKKREAAGEINQNAINEIYQLAMPLQQRLSKGLFRDNSLLQKVAKATMDQQQSLELEKRSKRKLNRRLDLVCAAYVGNLGRQVSMTKDQRDEFSKLLRENIDIGLASAAYLSYVVMIKASELPNEEFEKIFDETQLNAIRGSFAQVRGLKANLQQMGVLDE